MNTFTCPIPIPTRKGRGGKVVGGPPLAGWDSVWYLGKNIEQVIFTGVAWLSSVRIVSSQVNSANGRNPYS